MAVLAMFASLTFGACAKVGPGEVGIEVQFGKIQGTVLPPGMYGAVISHIETLSTRTQTYTMAGHGTEGAADGSVNVLARDQLPVTVDVSVMFHLNGRDAIPVFQNFGDRYDDNVVHPLVRTAVRDAASEFTAVDLIDRRGELQQRMTTLVRTALLSTLQGRGVPPGAVVVDNILIRNIDLPQTLDESIANVQRQRQQTQASIQANQTAQQEAARALTMANGDAAALIARTRADAEMLRIRSESQAAANRALSASLTPEFLQYERIQATRAVLGSHGTRTVFLPASMSPNMLMSMPQ